ncbi:MAG: FAD:protein FMN transferase, partial [Bacteroidales bacterium]
EPVLIKFIGETQGTYYAVSYFDTKQRNFQKNIDSLLNQFDTCASLWCENSELARVNRNEVITLSPMFIDLFNKSVSISKATHGYFDFTVGSLVNAYGFGQKKREGTQFSKTELQKYLNCIGYQKLQIQGQTLHKENPCIQIDFNAIAQGYSTDLIALFLENQGISAYLVDVGGEVYGKGEKPNKTPWVVGIEKPSIDANAEREIIGRVCLKNQALTTSGNYRKYFEANGIRYSHTINPFTGEAVHQNLLSVSVINPQTWKADALATAFMVMGLEKTKEYLAKDSETEVFLIFSNLKGELETWSSYGFKKYLLP